MSETDSEESTIEDASAPEEVEENRRGRPVGKTDSSKRYRRTAQEISDDKIRVAQMKLDAVREAEERKLAARKTRSKGARNVEESAAMPPPRAKKKACAPKPAVREESASPSPKHIPIRTGRQALYDSWFPSSPRTRNCSQ